jgi:hypothetical protein
MDTPKGAYIFAGGQKLGLQTATWLAQVWHCGGTDTKCATCHLISQGNYPDLLFINPDGASIGIAQVKELIAQLTLSRYETAGRRVVIVGQASLMTREAQNSLLKTLEEPPVDTTIVLLAENANALLPTIQSRSQVIYFPPEDSKSNQAAIEASVDACFAKSRFDRLVLAAEVAENKDQIEPFSQAFGRKLQSLLRTTTDPQALKQLAYLAKKFEDFDSQINANVSPKSALAGLLLSL